MPWPSFESLILDLHRAIGEIRGLLEANTERLDRIEAQQNKDRIKWSDLLPFLPGSIVLVLWLTGRIDTHALVGLLSGR